MVSKELIKKSLEDAVFKCSPSDKIRKIGASVTIKEHENEDGSRTSSYVYDDGTIINTIYNKPITVTDEGYSYETVTDMFTTVIYNGKEYQLSYGDSNSDDGVDEFFNYQKEYILDKYGDEGWEFFSKYSNQFGSSQGWNLNSLLRGKHKLSDITDEDGDFYINPFLVENHDRFVKMESELSLDREDSITLRLANGLFRNDSIGKKIVSDKGHTSTSTIGQISNYETYGDPYNGWFIFTINEKGSGVKGAYLGGAIKDDYGYDFEREVNYIPNQKFERLLIDEKNKFIIQKPI